MVSQDCVCGRRASVLAGVGVQLGAPRLGVVFYRILSYVVLFDDAAVEQYGVS